MSKRSRGNQGNVINLFGMRSVAAAFRMPPRSAPSKDDIAVIDTAYCEIQSLGVLTAVTCSAVAAVARGAAPATSSELWRHVPPSPVTLNVAAEVLTELGALPEAAVHIHRLSDQLGRAKDLLSDGRGEALASATRLHVDMVAHAWMGVAEAVLFALYDMHGVGERLGLSIDASKDAALEAALRSCRDGGAPCLNGQTLKMPEWAQRRRARRIPLNIEATLRHKGQVHPVRVTNVSRGGFGIAYCRDLVAGAIVVLTLETGRRFIGSIAWQQGDMAGLSLSRELAANDPLISAG